MFLSLAFGLFLGAPLVLLVGSLGRTAVTVSRGAKADDSLATTTTATATSAPGRMRARPGIGDTIPSQPVLASRPVATPSALTRAIVSRPIGLASAADAEILAFRGRSVNPTSTDELTRVSTSA